MGVLAGQLVRVAAGRVPALVTLLPVRRLTPPGRRRLRAGGGQGRFEQRRRRRREAQARVRVHRAGRVDRRPAAAEVDGDGGVGGGRRLRRVVLDDVGVEDEVVMLVVGRRVRQLGVAVERCAGAAAPVVVARRPRPDTAHLGGELRRRARVRAARARGARVQLDGRLQVRGGAGRPAPVGRAVRRD